MHCNFCGRSEDWRYTGVLFTSEDGNEIVFNVAICENCIKKFYHELEED